MMLYYILGFRCYRNASNLELSPQHNFPNLHIVWTDLQNSLDALKLINKHIMTQHKVPFA